MKFNTTFMLVVLLGMLATSCANSGKTISDTAEIGGYEVHEEIIANAGDSSGVESSVNDSIVTRSGSDSEGFGRCSKCNCKAFEGRGETCRNCGHAYKAHY